MDQNMKSKWLMVAFVLVMITTIFGIRLVVTLVLLVGGFSAVKIIFNHMGLGVTLNEWDIMIKNGFTLVKRVLTNEYKPEGSESQGASTFGNKTGEIKSESKEKIGVFSVLKEFFIKKDSKGTQKKSMLGSFFDGRDDRFKR